MESQNLVKGHFEFGQRDLVRGFSFHLLNAIDIGLEVTKSALLGGAAVNLNVKYINFEPM